MNKLLAALVAGLVSVGAFAQAPAPVAPATQAAPAVTPAPAAAPVKETKKKKASHKAKKAGHKAKKAAKK